MKKRQFLIAAGSVPLISTFGCLASEQSSSLPTVILDPSKLNTFDDLVREIIENAGTRVPKNVNVQEIYAALAKAFVERIEDAIAAGMKLPSEVLDLFRGPKKVLVPVYTVPGPVASFILWGVMFIIPLGPFVNFILGALVLMLPFILEAAKEAAEKRAVEKGTKHF